MDNLSVGRAETAQDIEEYSRPRISFGGKQDKLLQIVSHMNERSQCFPSPEQGCLIERAGAKESLLIVAGPGTGKSRTALAIALQKIRSLPSTSLSRVLFLSFSNATIRRLAVSAGMQFSASERKHLKFMTFHSC